MAEQHNNHHQFLMDHITQLIQTNTEFINIIKQQQDLLDNYLQHHTYINMPPQLSTNMQIVQAQTQTIVGVVAALSITAHLETAFNKLLEACEPPKSRVLTWLRSFGPQQTAPKIADPKQSLKLR